MTRLLWLALGLALAAAAVAAVMLVPDRLQLVFYMPSNGSNEIRVPVGYWAGVAIWSWLAARLLAVPFTEVAARAACVGFAVHAMVLLASYAPRLTDPAGFSSPDYLMYSRLFTAATLAFATGWAVLVVRRLVSASAANAAFDLPVLFAALVLAVALARVDSLLAAAGIISGFAGAWLTTTTWPRTLRRWASDERLFLICLFLVALGLRLLYLRRIMGDPGHLETGADGPVYDELAWDVARGRGIRSTFTDRFPLLLLGYVHFVSVVYRIAGHSYYAIGAVQSVVGAGACLLLYGTAKTLGGVAVARLASVFAAISFPLLFAAAAIGHQAIDVFLTLLVVWLLVRQPSCRLWAWWQWAGLGVIVGMSIAVRETMVFMSAFLALWIPFAFGFAHWRPSSRALLAFGLGVVVFLSPLVVPKVATAEKRLELRQHFDLLYRGEADAVPVRDELVGPLANPSAAFDQLRQSPGLVLVSLGRAYSTNFAVQFLAQPYGGFDLAFLRKGTDFYYGLWFYAYALASAGVVIAFVRIRRGGADAAGLALILGVIASRTLPHVVLESHYRHRVPVEPYLILLASLAAVAVVTAIRPLDVVPAEAS
jgi:dolichyl-phosphate-mannose-protein mannosyltransferase